MDLTFNLSCFYLFRVRCHPNPNNIIVRSATIMNFAPFCDWFGGPIVFQYLEKENNENTSWNRGKHNMEILCQEAPRLSPYAQIRSGWGFRGNHYLIDIK